MRHLWALTAFGLIGLGPLAAFADEGGEALKVCILSGCDTYNSEVHNRGRIFYTSLGAQATFREENFRRLLANALFWTSGRKMELKTR